MEVTKQYTYRAPLELAKRLERVKRQEKRSVQQQITAALERCFEEGKDAQR